MSLLLPAAAVLGALGVLVFLAAVVALWKGRPVRFAVRFLSGLLLLSIGALLGTVAVGVQGYRAFTREDVAARVMVQPISPQRFRAVVRTPDGRESRYDIAGDEIYLDARILKWKPLANVFGLHTAYELDRIAGRYRAIGDELKSPRTVYALGAERPVDLFDLRRRHAFLAPLVDAEYGSGTFVAVTQPTVLEVRVSTTGLLIRPAAASQKPTP